MGRPLTPKCKQCRRSSEKLFLKGERCLSVKCAIIRRNYPPGIHGPKGLKRRVSEYGLQLREKQKAKAMYRIGEKQFLNYYKLAVKSKANTGNELLRLLERRLDNVLFRLGLTTSRDQARQLVSHGHIKVNGRRIDVPSYLTRKGDKITIRENSSDFMIIKDAIVKKVAEVPEWLVFEEKDIEGIVMNMPEPDSLNLGIDSKSIIEYYSR